MAFATQYASLKVGQIVEYEARLWRVGLVNYTRARLDPLTPNIKTIHTPSGDKQVNEHGGSVNVSPSAIMKIVSADSLSEHEARQHAKLLIEEQKRKEAMPEVASTIPTETPEVAPAVGPATVSKNRQANKDRLAKLKAKQAAAKADKKAAKAAAPPREKKAKEMKPCKCGCGEQVAGHFAQGHDARFKGWLLKIERGDMKIEELPAVVRKSYEWAKVKRAGADGFIPTINYKGEKHAGYLLTDGSPRAAANGKK